MYGLKPVPFEGSNAITLEGAPSFLALFAGKGGKKMPLFACRIYRHGFMLPSHTVLQKISASSHTIRSGEDSMSNPAARHPPPTPPCFSTENRTLLADLFARKQAEKSIPAPFRLDEYQISSGIAVQGANGQGLVTVVHRRCRPTLDETGGGSMGLQAHESMPHPVGL